MEGQQLVRAIHRGIGVLLEGQGDVEAQAVIHPGTFVGRGHDAAAGTGDDHQVRAGEGGAQLPGQGVHGVFDRRARRTEYRDLAPSLVLFHHPEGVVEFAQGLQGDLGVPAVAVVVGHAQHGEHHVPVQRQVGAVGGDQVQLLVNVVEVDPQVLEVAG